VSELLRDNFGKVSNLLEAHTWKNPHICELWQAAQKDSTKVLRLSPQRTVLRVILPTGAWVLKIFHPNRKVNALRNSFRASAATRERELVADWCTGQADPTLSEFHSECVNANLTFLTRSWIEAPTLAFSLERSPEETAQIAANSLKSFLDAGWIDFDPSATDFLFQPNQSSLIPLDFGHAIRSDAPVPAVARHLLFLRLLATLTDDGPAARALAASAAPLCGRSPSELLESSRLMRNEQLRKRSHRCLRRCSDFRPHSEGGHIRRAYARVKEPASGEGANSCVLSKGRRSQVTRYGNQIKKSWSNQGLSRLAATMIGRQQARRSFRMFYLLELHGIPAAQAIAWSPQPEAGVLTTLLVKGHAPRISEFTAIARHLAATHRAGLGNRDPKPSNFMMTESGPVLVDADGIRDRLTRPARDLGRLLAEVQQESSWEDEITQTYFGAVASALPLESALKRKRFTAEARDYAKHFRTRLEHKAKPK